ncbi:hypothetical protein [Streptomyces sp. NPDC090022]|uniref:hypothetical protein n=1 Tax=Streptomyces sp. NPDC090022 TaxID=3365920 RepID=UPI00380ED393
MISEPELDGGWDETGAAGTAAPADPAGPERAGEPLAGTARGARRPWLWALGGVAAASAVWAGALFAAGGAAPERPEIAYRMPANLCDDLKAPRLTALQAGLRGDTPTHQEFTHPAMDRAFCHLETPGGGGLSTTAEVTLHRKVDPETEFEPRMEGSDFLVQLNRTAVPGLGEHAVMVTMDKGGYAQLTVLDGGAVLTLTAHVFAMDGRTKPEIDPDALQAALIEDMRTLMAALRV